MVVFYRGEWCPTATYRCEALTAKGYTVVAISPQAPEFAEAAKRRTSRLDE